MTIQIRAHPAGDELLLRLQTQYMPHDAPANIRIGWWWVMWDEATPIGFAGMHPSKAWLDTVYLCRCAVAPRARGMGLQKRLIRVREKKARQLGMQWMVTETWRNPASANSLIACGFKMFLPHRPWASNESTYWRKRLSTE